MLSDKEKEFILFWEKNGLKEKKNPKYLFIGASIGLFICLIIIILINSGVYERATMVANGWFSSAIYFVIIIVISIFFAIFYRSFVWEQYDQQYKELKSKIKKLSNAANQQNNLSNNQ